MSPPNDMDTKAPPGGSSATQRDAMAVAVDGDTGSQSRRCCASTCIRSRSCSRPATASALLTFADTVTARVNPVPTIAIYCDVMHQSSITLPIIED
jgi:hypothetical protein